MSELVENLKFEMALKGWNAYDLEKAAKVPQSTIHRVLSGKHRDPRTKTVISLAKGLGISEYQLRYKQTLREELIKVDTNKIEYILNKKDVSIDSFIESLGLDSEEWGSWKENGVPAAKILAVANVLDVESGKFIIQPEYKPPVEELQVNEPKSPQSNYLIHIINECERALNDSGKDFTADERIEWYFKALEKAGRDAYSNDLVKEMIRQLVEKSIVRR